MFSTLLFKSRLQHLLLTFAVVIGSASLAEATSTGHAAAGTLHVVGTQILDGSTPLAMHGVNRSGTEYACVQSTNFADGPTDKASIQAIAAWGVNTIRVPLNEDCWLGINGVTLGGTTYQHDVATWVRTITNAGLYAILELHWSAPGNYEAVGQEPMADLDHAPAFWTGVAQAFRNNGHVAFDLYNEPDPVPYSSSYPGGFSAWQNADFACVRDGCTATATQGVTYTTVGMQSLLTTVRGTGATNLVLISGIQYAQTITQYLGNADQPGSYLPSDSLNNLGVSTHMYAADACGDLSCWNSTIAPVAARYPVVATEFGDTDCTATLTNTLLPWLDSEHIGYVGWNWGTTFGCQSLITSYAGTPTVPYGLAYKTHLSGLTSTPLGRRTH